MGIWTSGRHRSAARRALSLTVFVGRRRTRCSPDPDWPGRATFGDRHCGSLDEIRPGQRLAASGHVASGLARCMQRERALRVLGMYIHATGCACHLAEAMLCGIPWTRSQQPASRFRLYVWLSGVCRGHTGVRHRRSARRQAATCFRWAAESPVGLVSRAAQCDAVGGSAWLGGP